MLHGLWGLVLVGTVGAAVPEDGGDPGADRCGEACEESAQPGDAVMTCQGIEVGPAPPVALVMSGGISAGVYLAGQAHVVVEHLRRAEQRRQALLKKLASGEIREPGCQQLAALGSRQDVVITGASAGTVSALAAFATLLQPGLDMNPEDSVFFSIWMQLGIDQSPSSMDHVPRGKDGGEDWLFTLDGLNPTIDQLRMAFHPDNRREEAWSGDIRIGFTTTRVKPTQMDGGLYVQAKEAWALEWPSGAKNPRWLRQPVEDDSQPPDELVIGKRHVDNPMESSELDALVELVQASGAFPLAFKPRTVSCGFHERVSYYRTPCAPKETEIGFIDGGFFDNNPGALGAELACRDWEAHAGTMRACEPVVMFPDPDFEVLLDGSLPEEPHRGLERSGALTTLDELRRTAEEPDELSAISSLVGFGGKFVPVIQNLGLADHYRDNPEQRKRAVAMPQRTRPGSARAGAFLGFFDRTVRAWDFYAGMYDATLSLSVPRRGAEAALYPKLGPAAARALMPDGDADYGQRSYYWAVRDSFERFHRQLPVTDDWGAQIRGGGGADGEALVALLEQGRQAEAQRLVRELVRAQFPANAAPYTKPSSSRTSSSRVFSSCGTYPYTLWTPISKEEVSGDKMKLGRAAFACQELSSLSRDKGNTRVGTTSMMRDEESSPFDFDPFRFEPPRGRRGKLEPETMVARNLEVLTVLALEEQLRVEEYPSGRCSMEDLKLAISGKETSKDANGADGEVEASVWTVWRAEQRCAVELAGHTDTWFLTELALPQSWCPTEGTSLYGCRNDLAHAWFTPFDLDDHVGDYDPWASLLRRRLYHSATEFLGDDLHDTLPRPIKFIGPGVSRVALQTVVGDSLLWTAEVGNQGVGYRFHKYANRPNGFGLSKEGLTPRRPWSKRGMWMPRSVFGGGVRFRPGLADQTLLLRGGMDLGIAFRFLKAHQPQRDPLFGSERALSFEPALYGDVVLERDLRVPKAARESGYSAVAGAQLTARVVDLVALKGGFDMVSVDLSSGELGLWTSRVGSPSKCGGWVAVEIGAPAFRRSAPYGLNGKQRRAWKEDLKTKAEVARAAHETEARRDAAAEPPSPPATEPQH